MEAGLLLPALLELPDELWEITAHPTQPTLIQAPTTRPAASAAVCLSSLDDGSACRGVSECLLGRSLIAHRPRP